MGKIILIFSFWFALITQSIYPQNSILSGHIYDSETGKPIYNVNIKEKNTTNGTTSNEEGYFLLKLNKVPSEIQFSHVAYKKTSRRYTITPEKAVKISMEKQVDSLPEATVMAHNITNIVERKLFDVVDYEFYGDSILLLTYSWKDKINPWLILMNNSGDTLFRKPVMKEGTLYRDCLRNIHLVTKDTAYQIFIDKENIHLLYPLNSDTFHKILDPCITEISNKFYIRQWSLHNQVLSYNLVNTNDSSKKTIRVISDERAIRMLADRNHFYSMGTTAPSDADIRFEEMCFFSPVFAPLLKIKDKIVIFNFVNSKMEIYNETGLPVKEIPILFHKTSGWKEDIISDEVTGKVYAVYKSNGLTKIREINLENGNTLKEIPVPAFKYIENVKAYNGYLYFMYRANAPLELTNLYKMGL